MLSPAPSPIMLRLLLHLSTLMALAGPLEGASLPFSYDFSSCPITYFEKVYTRLYVNVTTDELMICFKGYYDSGTEDDCIQAPLPDAGTPVDFFSGAYDSAVESKVTSEVTTITEPMNCSVFVEYQYMSHTATVSLISFGTRAAMGLEYSGTTYFTFAAALVNGSFAAKASVDASDTADFTDISGCRSSGYGVYTTGSRPFDDICEVHHCSIDRNITVERCGEYERCDGRGTCIKNNICTLTGPTVIDINGQVNSVEDRCTYSLLSFPKGFPVEVQANYRERRRRDVSFLDSLTLVHDGFRINLEQGGRVQVNGSHVNLSSSVQNFDGFELSRSQSGVRAKISFLTVLFDGSTAQLQIEVPGSYQMNGLCMDSSTSTWTRTGTSTNPSSCETQYTDPHNGTINCNLMSERCSFLRDAPFSSCHAAVHPDPYVTACNETMCRYPAVDGLECQFLEAYATACSLKISTTLEGWRSNTNCSMSQTSCQQKSCSDHEFCGLDSGRASCLCRAIFASPYRSLGVMGDPAVCSSSSVSLTLMGCLLEEIGIDYTALQLKNQSCRGKVDDQNHLVTFSFDRSNDCGGKITASDLYVMYQNTIVSSDIITRRRPFQIELFCLHIKPWSMSFRVKDGSIIIPSTLTAGTTGSWNYTMMMKAYTDAHRTQIIDPNTEVLLNQKIWVELVTEGLDADTVAVVTDACWATDQEMANGSLRYDLIQNSCPNVQDSTVKMEGNGEGTSSYFSFNSFEFMDSSGDLYLHCQFHLCLKKDNDCVPIINSFSDLPEQRSSASSSSRRCMFGAWLLVSMVTTVNQ